MRHSVCTDFHILILGVIFIGGAVPKCSGGMKPRSVWSFPVLIEAVSKHVGTNQ